MSFLRYLFLPYHKNNHKAHLIKSYSLFLLSFFFIFFQITLSFFSMARPSVLGYSSNISPERIIELTNIERSALGLNPVRENKLLSEAARRKAGDMYAFNYWAHISPSGRTPWAFFNDVGYKYQYAGENLARDFKDPDSVVRAWMNSPSHKENVINSKYQEIGVAVVDGNLQGVETTLVVQLFGTQFNALPVEKNPEKVVKAPDVKPAVEIRKTETNESLVNNSNPVPVSNPLDVTKIVTILIVGVLLGVFVADVYIVSQKHTPRFSSKSMAQMMFLIFILILSFFIKEGAIL